MMNEEMMEDCNTQNAASILSAGICNLLYRNQSPIVSPKTMTSPAMSTCICSVVLNTVWSWSLSPLPKAKVM